jgi:starch synthase
MEIFHISAECYPVAKVGGLADVVGALSKFQNKVGHLVRVVIPCYDIQYVKENEFESVYAARVKLGKFNFPFEILKEKENKLGFELYLVAIPELFDRKEIYAYEDDIERFLSFQIAFLDWLVSKDSYPDIINCHDHHTGLIPFMMLYAFKYEKLQDIPTLITIHSSLYQGQFGFDKLYYLPDFDLSHVHVLQWNHQINSMAVGLKCAWAVTTVSPNYLNEINYSGNGLESLFSMVRYKSKGILNGIDTEVWNPETDIMIAKNYAVDDYVSGKQRNKETLCKRFDLDVTKPLFSFIGRLLVEKGADLLAATVALALTENRKEINILILGSGDAQIENQLKKILVDFEGSYNVCIGYNEELAHLIYAGSDFLLMPSRIEPCGLNQMYAFRYGTVPVVRRTGGLKDTVIDIGDTNGNGICHDQASVSDICTSIQRAMQLYSDKEKFSAIRKLGMSLDHSWETAFKEYIEMYNLIIKKI